MINKINYSYPTFKNNLNAFKGNNNDNTTNPKKDVNIDKEKHIESNYFKKFLPLLGFAVACGNNISSYRRIDKSNKDLELKFLNVERKNFLLTAKAMITGFVIGSVLDYSLNFINNYKNRKTTNIKESDEEVKKKYLKQNKNILLGLLGGLALQVSSSIALFPSLKSEKKPVGFKETSVLYLRSISATLPKYLLLGGAIGALVNFCENNKESK